MTENYWPIDEALSSKQERSWNIAKENLLKPERKEEVTEISLLHTLHLAFNAVGRDRQITTTPEHMVCLVTEILRSRGLPVPSKAALETLSLNDLYDERLGPIEIEDC